MRKIIYLFLFFNLSNAHASEYECAIENLSTLPGDLIQVTKHLTPIFEVFEKSLENIPLLKNEGISVHFKNDLRAGAGILQTDHNGNVSCMNIRLSNGIVAGVDHLFKIVTRYEPAVYDLWQREIKAEACYLSVIPLLGRTFSVYNTQSSSAGDLASFQITDETLEATFAKVKEFDLWRKSK